MKHTEMQTHAGRVLRHLVSLKRPHGSPEEGSAIAYLCETLSWAKWVDGAGNLHVDTRRLARHRTLFVAHTDTVHRTGGPNAFLEDSKGLYAVDSPLGADDAAGVSILAAMLERVPGYYIFTRGEERGGIGSKYLAENHAELLGQFDRAIAFDRKGTSDIITHQWSGRCCSDEFAEALSGALNDKGMLYMPSDNGVYTDTAEFIDIIPECTNISVGYYWEHSDKEWLDTEHHMALLDAALTIDWDSLPVSRGVSDYDWSADDADFPPANSVEDDICLEACLEAIAGKPRNLLQLVAENILPDDPAAAARCIDMFSLSPDRVRHACAQSPDWESVIDFLANESFVQP